MAFALPPLRPLSSSASASASAAPSSSSTSFNYRPAVILPGLGNNSSDYKKLEVTLKEHYGVPTVVAKVSRLDWLRNAAGLADPNYWSGTLRPRPVLDWYLKRVDEAVQEAKELAQGGTLSLIGHSAGGWLARVYMEEFGLSHISLLLTLGTPHLYIQGARFFRNSSADVVSAAPNNNAHSISEVATVNDVSTLTSNATTFRVRFVGQGYKQVCGQADVWGDGVVPEVSAHLEGAFNISLDGVYHSPVGSDDALRPWYGSPAVVDKWIHHLLN
ncbi:hypothetical protein FH972_003699 [Carpinus fangiana]|uniref:GPI inositol-deacylase n=1 Tax=Carpinus fangiana TaxID=176857 RepID=A0A5N6QIT2_9ROSI|nr:hypothetical protein FH972_003699 [Carpinus fangiana]